MRRRHDTWTLIYTHRLLPNVSALRGWGISFWQFLASEQVCLSTAYICNAKPAKRIVDEFANTIIDYYIIMLDELNRMKYADI